jgi:hypothetical protein
VAQLASSTAKVMGTRLRATHEKKQKPEQNYTPMNHEPTAVKVSKKNQTISSTKEILRYIHHHLMYK